MSEPRVTEDAKRLPEELSFRPGAGLGKGEVGDGESFWVFEVAGDGGGGEEGLVVFEFSVLIFEIA